MSIKNARKDRVSWKDQFGMISSYVIFIYRQLSIGAMCI
jgi:hypothetical protein